MNKITFTYREGLGGVFGSNDSVSMLIFDVLKPVQWEDDIKIFRSTKQAEESGMSGLELHHVSEFFRMSPFSKLYVNFKKITANDIFMATGGEVRQLGILSTHLDLGALQVLVNELGALGCPVVVIAGIESVDDLDSLTDLTLKNYPQIAAIAAGDGLVDYEPAYGLALGVLSAAKIHECIGWVERFNILDIATNSYSSVKLLNNELSTSENLVSISEKGYNAIVHYVGDSGAYFSDSVTAVAGASDFSTLENNRTIQKAVRGVYLALLPKINSPLYVDATSGKLDAVTIGDFQSTGQRPLAAMSADGEVSGYSVYVNPEQNVLATSKVEVEVKIIPVGVAREIAVTIGLTAKL